MKKLYPLTLLLIICGTITVTAQVNLRFINSPYAQNFDSLASTGTLNDISTLPKGWTFFEAGTNANTSYAAGTGSSNTGNTYSFGSDAGDRALGGLLSGSVTPTIGAGFVNRTGSTITSISVSYQGEQWRLGTSGRGPDRLDFQYSLDAVSLSTGVWTDVNALDFSGPVTVGTVGALNGNDSLNNTYLSFTITGLNLDSGAVFYLRWLDFNPSGGDDGLAIDDFVLVPNGIPSTAPSIALIPEALNFGDVNVNGADTLLYNVAGANLVDSINISVSNTAYSLSSDGFTFGPTISLTDSGGLVYVRFAPTEHGSFSDTVYHSSGSTSSLLHVTGNGFDQVAAIISIAEARTKPVGQKVTIAGRITVADEHGNPAYVQDGTGGIPVFDFALASSVNIGDSVIVTGPIGIFNDQKQISGNGIFFTKADSSNRVLLPKLISIGDLAANEGLLVTVEDIEMVDKNFVFYPQSTERITAGGVQADLRIDGDTDIAGLTKPQGIFDVTGVVGRFRTNAQLLPRFRQDIPGSSEPSDPTDSISTTETFDVVNWNLEFFGARREDYPEEFGPADEALQLQNVKTVIESLHADVIAVQEISNDSLFAVLVSQLGHYAALCSDRYSYSFEGPSNTFPPQKVCIIYDTTTVHVLNARVLFENLYDSARTIDGSLIPGYPSGDASSFYSSGRLPFMLTANVTINGVTEKISFIDVHAKSGAAAADRNRRLYDASVLKDSLDAHYPDEQFIFLGDLNDDLDQSITTGQPSPYANFVSDTSGYIPVTKVLSDAGARSTLSFGDVIDHQIISNDLEEEYLDGSARIFTPFLLIPNYGATTSDHLPVRTRYKFQSPEISFVQGSLTVQEINSTHVVRIVSSEASSEVRSIRIALGGDATYGSDYITVPASANGLLLLTLPADSTGVSFQVKVLHDVADELQETAVLTLQSSDGMIPGSQPGFMLSIEDNDIPVVSFEELLGIGKEGSGDHLIKLRLSVPPATDQQVTIQVYDGPGVSYDADYATSPAVVQKTIVLNVPAGSSQLNFTLTPKDDNKRELPEIISFYISEVSSGLQMTLPRLTLFTILDGTRRQPNFVVYPNPTVGSVLLTANEVAPNEKVLAELRNPAGTLIYSGSATFAQLSTIATNKIQPGLRGVYTLKINLDGETYLLRILKN